ncbi:MAG: beta-ketoacyl-[acyl-carrier-protein] synthase family protein [Candidatus Omnitrophica bacterium]|nr:beta-ketoacyl-[acyl-carrier-protein] synthase family protein [Candidatus Omnitrophota bacterium]
MKRRVVVTGLGVISSIGIGRDEFWKNLIAGRSGISDIESFDTSGYPVHKGGEVKNFDPLQFIPKNRLNGMARASQFAIAAARLAFDDAGLNASGYKNKKVAVILGTTMGEGGMIEEVDKHWIGQGEEDIWAATISKYPGNAISDNVARFFDFNGISFVVPTACSGGNYAIGQGYDIVRTGMADLAMVGGSDPFSRIALTGFNRLFAMESDMCRPFDKNRAGMMLGEGAGILILEDLESAKKRGANIYAEIKGYGLSCDADHMTAPRVESIVKVMERAIKNSGVDKEDIGYISAHGTGTPANDKAECQAIRTVFGDLSKKLCVSAVKSMLGHTMGAASAIEAIACCLVIKEGIISPTINYEVPDPDCDIDCVPNRSKKCRARTVLNNSFAFGGNNACLVLKDISFDKGDTNI